MNTLKSNSLIPLLALLIAVPAVAQNQRRVQIPVKSSPATGSSHIQAQEENLSIRLEGMTSTGQEIDLALTGIGPDFATDHILPEDDTVLSCHYTLAQAEDGGLIVKYEIGMRVLVPARQPPQNGPRPIQFQQVVTTGQARCQLGEPVVIKKGKNHSLTLTVSKENPAAEKDKGSNQPKDAR